MYELEDLSKNLCYNIERKKNSFIKNLNLFFEDKRKKIDF